MPPDLFTYHPPIPNPAGPVQLVRFVGWSELRTLHGQFRDHLNGRLQAGRAGNFGDCVAHEAKAAAIATEIEAVMVDHGYPTSEITALIADTRHAATVAFRQWEEAYTVSEAGKLSAREAHPEWFTADEPATPYEHLRQALAYRRWAKKAGQERFAYQQHLSAGNWANELERAMKRDGHDWREIAEAMGSAWQQACASDGP